jgi:hypothetical protein
LTASCVLDVEALITQATQDIVSKSPSLHPHHKVIAGKVVEALESDSSWVEMFRITGEINVPSSNESEGSEEFVEAVEAVKEVSSSKFPLGSFRIDDGLLFHV